MTHRQNFASLSSGTDYEQLANRFRPIFERIAEGAIERERTRTLPHEPIAWLKPSHYTHLPPLYPIVLSDEHRERADELGEAGV